MSSERSPRRGGLGDASDEKFRAWRRRPAEVKPSVTMLQRRHDVENSSGKWRVPCELDQKECDRLVFGRNRRLRLAKAFEKCPNFVVQPCCPCTGGSASEAGRGASALLDTRRTSRAAGCVATRGAATAICLVCPAEVRDSRRPILGGLHPSGARSLERRDSWQLGSA